MTTREEEILRALVYEAFELRGTPYFRDACAHIADCTSGWR